MKPWSFAVLSLLGMVTAGSTWAQAPAAYPSRPVMLVVPFVPGGPTDTEPRPYLAKLQESMGQPFVFDFKPGAGTTIGVGYVAKAVPDGHTLLLTSAGVTVFPNFYPNLPFEVTKDLAPITQLSERPTVLLISPAALPNVHSIAELTAFGKANPGSLRCGTSGAGSIIHIVCASLSSAMGVPITAVHYKGVAQGQVDLIAGRIQLSQGTVYNALSQIKAGKLRAIASLDRQRTRYLPDVSTALEQAVDVEFPNWLGVFAPGATPAPIVNRLNAEFVRIIRDPDNMRNLEKIGIIGVGNTPGAFQAKIVSETARWRRVIQEKGIKIEE